MLGPDMVARGSELQMMRMTRVLLVVCNLRVASFSTLWGFGPGGGGQTCNEAHASILASFRDQQELMDRVGLSQDNIDESISRLARCCEFGKNKNVKRDMMAAIGDPHTVRPVIIQMPCSVRMDQIEYVDFRIFCPHMIMSHWFHECRDRFDEFFFGCKYDATILPAFWKEVTARRDPRIQHHPMCNRRDWHHHAIPIEIHGDGVSTLGIGRAGTKSFEAWSMKSVLSRGASSVVKQYLGGMFDDSKVKPSPTSRVDSMECFFRTLLWSFLAAYLGENHLPTGTRKHSPCLLQGCWLVVSSSSYGR